MLGSSNLRDSVEYTLKRYNYRGILG